MTKNKLPISIPALALAIYFACEPLTFITAFGGMSLLKLATMPILLVLVVYLFLGKSDLRFNLIHLLAIIYLIWSTTTLLFYKTASAVTQLKDLYLAYGVLILATIRPINKREQKLIDVAWLLVGIVCVYLVMTSNETIWGDRTVIVVNGSEEDPNQFCLYFVVPILTALKIITKEKGILKKLLMGVYLGFVFFAILKTGSRGGLLGVCTAVLVYLWFSTKGVGKKIVMLLLVAVAAVMAWTFLLPLMPEGVQKRLSVEAVQSDKGSGRFTIWKFLVSYAFNSNFKTTLIGHGLLSTETIMRENYFANGVAHQQLVQCFFDQGIVGALIYVTLIATCLLRNVKRNPFAFAALCSVIVFSMSLTFYTFKPMINILMLCAMTHKEGEISGIPIEQNKT